MIRKSIFAYVLIFYSLGFTASSQVTATQAVVPVMTIQELKKLRLPDVDIKTVEHQDVTDKGKMSFCRVVGVIGIEINFELLLPDQWNGRFVMGGGGGFVGEVQNNERGRVHEGYATVGTDTGHKGSGIKADWAYNNLERQVNFGHLAVHRTAEVAKAILYHFYGTDSAYSYFLGCSRGGGQAMMEAQRYPDDFDGIVAGAPAFTWPAVGAEFIQNMQYLYPISGKLSEPVVTRDNLKLLQQLILDQCDEMDGIGDGILNDPRECSFDLDFLPVCPDDHPSEDCFTRIQIEAIRAIYAGPASIQGEIYPGFPFGGENELWGWYNWITGPFTGSGNMNFPSLQFGFGTEIFKYLVFNDTDWDYLKYDFTNFEKDTQLTASNLNAAATDYKKFRDLGGKMIIYHGWSDAALSALSTIEHYESVLEMDPSADAYLRLFLLPGVLHCGGGPGPDYTDWLKIIRNWVENGKAPDRIIMSKITNGETVKTRPVFPYPRKAIYDGKGNPDVESSFH
jgi:hypothetical protein